MRTIYLFLCLAICTAFFSKVSAQDTIPEIIQDTVFNNNIKNAEDDPVFMFVEKPPQFPGGEKARFQFISDNIKYPQIAREKGIQGTVYISFIIEPDGTITNIKVRKGIGGGCDEECVRIVKMMPPWEPGTQRGKPVRVSFNMPIKFTLDSGTESKKARKKLSKEEKKKLLY